MKALNGTPPASTGPTRGGGTAFSTRGASILFGTVRRTFGFGCEAAFEGGAAAAIAAALDGGTANIAEVSSSGGIATSTGVGGEGKRHGFMSAPSPLDLFACREPPLACGGRATEGAEAKSGLIVLCPSFRVPCSASTFPFLSSCCGPTAELSSKRYLPPASSSPGTGLLVAEERADRLSRECLWVAPPESRPPACDRPPRIYRAARRAALRARALFLLASTSAAAFSPLTSDLPLCPE
jgi:hypothetical protein